MGMSKYRIKREPKPINPSTPQAAIYMRSCKDIVAEALTQSKWVFDPLRKDWFTPEEFKALNERIVVGNQNYLDQVQIKDPREGIKAGYQRMLDIQIKHEDFVKRVVDYYKGKNNGI